MIKPSGGIKEGKKMTVEYLIKFLKDKDKDAKVYVCREDIIYPATSVWCEDGEVVITDN